MSIKILAAILDSATILNFTGHRNSLVYIFDSENILFDIFLYFLCQLQTEINKFFHRVAVILDFGSYIGCHIEILQSYKYRNWNPWLWKPNISNVSLFLLLITDRDMQVYWISAAILVFGSHVEFSRSYNYWNRIPWPWKSTNRHISLLSIPLGDRNQQVFILFWQPYWILSTILNFTGHRNSLLYIFDSENILFDIFLRFLCPLQTEINKFFHRLAAILDFVGHIGCHIEIL